MTVKELIEQLQTLDPDLHVFVRGYEGGYDDAGPASSIMEVALDVHKEWYYGKHEEADTAYYVPDKSKHTIVKGVIL
jgi:hypothetical protein